MNLKSIKNMKSNLKYWNPRNTRYGWRANTPHVWISFSESVVAAANYKKLIIVLFILKYFLSPTMLFLYKM